jgi:hypothetical protein
MPFHYDEKLRNWNPDENRFFDDAASLDALPKGTRRWQLLP